MSITLPLLLGLTEMAAGLPPDNSLNPYSVFKLFVINCRGLKSKKDSFVHLIHSHSPHFIAGTESWLDPTTLSNEIFPVNYQVFRNDRSDGYGGVFFACYNTIDCSQVTFTSPCEVIICRVEMINSKVLIVVTAYRPPNRDLVYMQNLCQFISEIHSKYKNAVIWITGDFNLPDINWSLNSVTSNSYPLDISTLLIDEFNSGGFIQMVNQPTRGNNILDLFATNRPSLVEHTKVIPGISDHKIVSVELTLSVTVNKPKVHNVYLWNRADFQDINDVIIQFSNTFLSDKSVDIPVQELWDSFKTMCQKCLELVPCKSLSSSIKYPWITT